MTFTDELKYKNILSENLSSMIYGLSVSSSVTKLSMDLKTDKTCQTKKNYPF